MMKNNSEELEPWEIAEQIWEEEIGGIERDFQYLFDESCTLEEAVKGAYRLLDKYKVEVAKNKEKNRGRHDNQWLRRNYHIKLRKEILQYS